MDDGPFDEGGGGESIVDDVDECSMERRDPVCDDWNDRGDDANLELNERKSPRFRDSDIVLEPSSIVATGEERGHRSRQVDD
jgi:hypothetical protein